MARFPRRQRIGHGEANVCQSAAQKPESVGRIFTALGFGFDPKLTNDHAACMVVCTDIYVMLFVEPFFQTFTDKELCEATQATEVLVCISCDSREQVDDLVAKAAKAGGSIPRQPRTSALHTATALRIQTGISGSSSTGCPARRSKPERSRGRDT
jgi:predicted lactoylglutathione lyase